MNNEHYPITIYGMPILTRKTEPVKKIDTEFISMVERMFTTMHNADGIGLAAPQVNINSSFCVIDISMIEDFKDVKPLTLINPKITDSHGEIIFEEGCLSIPGIKAEITRPEKILVKYTDLNEKEVELEADDFLARVIQHEIDHINGVLFIDRMSKEEKSALKEKLDRIKRGETDAHYPILIAKK